MAFSGSDRVCTCKKKCYYHISPALESIFEDMVHKNGVQYSLSSSRYG